MGAASSIETTQFDASKFKESKAIMDSAIDDAEKFSKLKHIWIEAQTATAAQDACKSADGPSGVDAALAAPATDLPSAGQDVKKPESPADEHAKKDETAATDGQSKEEQPKRDDHGKKEEDTKKDEHAKTAEPAKSDAQAAEPAKPATEEAPAASAEAHPAKEDGHAA